MTCALVAVGLVAVVTPMLYGARSDYARHNVSGWDKTCGPGIARCPETALCNLDDYTYVLPVGHCENACEHERQMCWKGRECRDDGSGTLACVRVYDFWR